MSATLFENNQTQAASRESTRLKEKAQKLEEECNLLKKTLEARQNDFATLQELETELSHLCSTQEKKIAELLEHAALTENQLSEVKSLFEEEKQKNQKTDTELNRLQELCAGLKRKLKEKAKIASDQRTQELEEQIQTQTDEIIQLKSALETYEIQSLDQYSRTRQLEQYEKRLERYLTHLNQQKTQIKQLSSQLMEVVETGKKTHPLQDYLTLTEFELSKIELQLKKTPTSSPERSKLNEQITQLTEQRDFVRRVLSQSLFHLEEQAIAILRISQDPTLAPLPPSPPIPQSLLNHPQLKKLDPSEA